MNTATVFIPIDMIRVSAKQTSKVCQKKVRRHLESLDAGDELMPIDVRQLDDGTYIIAGNGRHRYFAYREAGYTTIPVSLKSRCLETLRRLTKRLMTYVIAAIARYFN